MNTSLGFMESAHRSLIANGDIEPTVYDFRRSISTVYYAVFHYLAELCATEIVGSRADKLRPKGAWREYYQSLSHSRIRAVCMRSDHNQFSNGSQNFLQWFPFLLGSRKSRLTENFLIHNCGVKGGIAEYISITKSSRMTVFAFSLS